MFHVGGPGAGHTIKLINNFVAQAVCTAVAEAFAVGQRAGIDLKKFVEMVSVGAVNSGLFQMMSQDARSGDLGALKFELDYARKDIRYYTHLAEGLANPTVVGEAVHQSLVARQRARLRQEVRAVARGSARAVHRREARSRARTTCRPGLIGR